MGKINAGKFARDATADYIGPRERRRKKEDELRKKIKIIQPMASLLQKSENY